MAAGDVGGEGAEFATGLDDALAGEEGEEGGVALAGGGGRGVEGGAGEEEVEVAGVGGGGREEEEVEGGEGLELREGDGRGGGEREGGDGGVVGGVWVGGHALDRLLDARGDGEGDVRHDGCEE